MSISVCMVTQNPARRYLWSKSSQGGCSKSSPLASRRKKETCSLTEIHHHQLEEHTKSIERNQKSSFKKMKLFKNLVCQKNLRNIIMWLNMVKEMFKHLLCTCCWADRQYWSYAFSLYKRCSNKATSNSVLYRHVLPQQTPSIPRYIQ